MRPRAGQDIWEKRNISCPAGIRKPDHPTRNLIAVPVSVYLLSAHERFAVLAFVRGTFMWVASWNYSSNHLPTIGKHQFLLLSAQIAARGALNQYFCSHFPRLLSKSKSENAPSQHFDVLSNANIYRDWIFTVEIVSPVLVLALSGREGQDSVLGIATAYGLDGSGCESR